MQQLTPIQSQVLAGLLSGQPLAAVARDHGIHRSTIYNWRHQHPHFTFALDQARSRLQATLYDDVQDLGSQALEVLADLLHSADNNIRLRVAQTILRTANPLRANKELHMNAGFETLSDHVAGREAIATLASSAPPEFDTIRHSSTEKNPSPPEPSRNQPCPCNSGIKYKRCCGASIRPASTAIGH